MYARLFLDVNCWDKTKLFNKKPHFYSLGKLLCENYSKSFIKSYRSIINDSKPLDSSEIEKIWFPDVPCNIFISHSHKDKELAIELAGLLKEEYGLDCFVDSLVWKHEDELFAFLEQKYNYDAYCDCPLNNEEISKQNKEFCILLTNCALMKMIDKCDCLLFLKTENSMPYQSVTYSPWIHSEILTADLIRKACKTHLRDSLNEGGNQRPTLNLNLKPFTKVSLNDFDEIKRKYGTTDSVSFLNHLYEFLINRDHQ